MAQLVQIVTTPVTADLFLRGQLAYMREAGFDVTVVSSGGAALARTAEREGVRSVALPMLRRPAPVRDTLALARLYRLLRKLRPDITHVSTPKAGLLGGLAARFAGVPARVYTLRGLRAEGATGIGGRALLAFERTACRSADRVICVSESLRRRALELGLAPEEKLTVLGSGSSNGVDAERFRRSPDLTARAGELRSKLGLPEGAPVVGFVGRLVRDKGVVELAQAMELLAAKTPEVRLVVVGAFEGYDEVPAAARARMEDDPRIVFTGFLADPAPAYALMDLLALPSYREGFPNAVLEAAAMEIPTVTTDATGCVDAVVDGVTGKIVPVGDSAALAEALGGYLTDDELRRRHGRAARERVVRDFTPEDIWKALLDEYVRLLAAKGLGLPGGAG